MYPRQTDAIILLLDLQNLALRQEIVLVLDRDIVIHVIGVHFQLFLEIAAPFQDVFHLLLVEVREDYDAVVRDHPDASDGSVDAPKNSSAHQNEEYHQTQVEKFVFHLHLILVIFEGKRRHL